MQVYVSHVSGYVGRAIAAALLEDASPEDVRVTGSVVGSEAVPPGVVETASAGTEGTLDLALAANVVILDLFGMHEESAAVIAALREAPDAERVIIAVSSILAWARTTLPRSGGDITEARWRKRRPAPEAQALKTLETHVGSLAREGVRVHVVAAGVLYGEGEAALAPVFKQAWLCETDAVTVPTADGVGGNALPMIHVADLGAAVACLAREEVDTPYLLAVDDGHASLAQVTLAIAKALGHGRIYTPPQAEGEALVLSHAPLAELQVNLRLDMEDATLGSLPMAWRAREGFREHAAAVAAEYVAARALTPVRVLVSGAPLAGKSAIAGELSREYAIPVITPAAAVAALAADPPALTGADSAQPPPGPALVGGAEDGEGKEAASGEGKGDEEEEGEEEEEEPTPFQAAETALRGLVREALASSGASAGGGSAWAVTPAAALALPPKLLARAVRHECMRPEARNRGWILDGFPVSVAAASVLLAAAEEGEEEDWEALVEVSTPRGGKGRKGRVPLEDEEDDEEPPVVEVDPAMAPRAFLVVQAPPEVLAARLAAVPAADVVPGYTDADGVAARTAEYAAAAKDDGARSLAAFLEANTGLAAVEVDGAAQAPKWGVEPVFAAVDGGKRPYNFHPTPAELATAAALAQEVVDADAAAAGAAASALAADEASETAARDAERGARLAAIAAHERDLLELRSVPLRQYLVQAVVPTLTEGLAEVCRVQPADPITHLAQFLYAASQEEGEAASAV